MKFLKYSKQFDIVMSESKHWDCENLKKSALVWSRMLVIKELSLGLEEFDREVSVILIAIYLLWHTKF